MNDIQEKFDALKSWLLANGDLDDGERAEVERATADESYSGYESQFDIADRTYAVFTDEEADEEVREYILSSLWAFNTDFIIDHSHIDVSDLSDIEFSNLYDALEKVQRDLCESANGLVKALISDIDDFIDDAVYYDGRAHFMNTYDDEENEYDGYYIYRVD